MSVAIATASADSGVVSLRVIVPVDLAGRRRRDGRRRGRATSADGSAGDDRDRLEALERRVAVDDGRVQRVAVGRVDGRVVVGDRELGRERRRRRCAARRRSRPRSGLACWSTSVTTSDGVAREGGRILRCHRARDRGRCADGDGRGQEERGDGREDDHQGELLTHEQISGDAGWSQESSPQVVPTALGPTGGDAARDYNPRTMPIYLDHAATTPLRPEVLEAMTAVPRRACSATRRRRTRSGGPRARRSTTRTSGSPGPIGAEARELVFTSGGTEANNLALKGAAWAGKSRGHRIVTTAVEHHAVGHALRVPRALRVRGRRRCPWTATGASTRPTSTARSRSARRSCR